jgi:hypothetical protein
MGRSQTRRADRTSRRGPRDGRSAPARTPEAKAEEDYVKRTKDPLGADPGSTAFVFLTARRWSEKEDRATDKQKEGVWREVRVLDADD